MLSRNENGRRNAIGFPQRKGGYTNTKSFDQRQHHQSATTKGKIALQRCYISEATQRDRKTARRPQGRCARLSDHSQIYERRELLSIICPRTQLGDSMLCRCTTSPRQYSGVRAFFVSVCLFLWRTSATARQARSAGLFR